MVLPEFVAAGTSLVWTWFAAAWTYAILAVPILLLPAALGRCDDAVLRVATYLGATSVVLSLSASCAGSSCPGAGPFLCHRERRHPVRC